MLCVLLLLPLQSKAFAVIIMFLSKTTQNLRMDFHEIWYRTSVPWLPQNWDFCTRFNLAAMSRAETAADDYDSMWVVKCAKNRWLDQAVFLGTGATLGQGYITLEGSRSPQIRDFHNRKTCDLAVAWKQAYCEKVCCMNQSLFWRPVKKAFSTKCHQVMP